MEQTLVDEDADVGLTEELQERVSQHAQRGIDFVDEQVTATEVEQQYDELYVTAEFERGEISGYIDHLILTPDAYHIVDYKTGAVAPEDVEEDAEYYLNQMKAYAIALSQQNSARKVRVSLVFTDINESWEIEWSTADVDSIEQDLQRYLHDQLS